VGRRSRLEIQFIFIKTVTNRQLNFQTDEHYNNLVRYERNTGFAKKKKKTINFEKLKVFFFFF
jgi:hypothetical protein